MGGIEGEASRGVAVVVKWCRVSVGAAVMRTHWSRTQSQRALGRLLVVLSTCVHMWLVCVVVVGRPSVGCVRCYWCGCGCGGVAVTAVAVAGAVEDRVALIFAFHLLFSFCCVHFGFV